MRTPDKKDERLIPPGDYCYELISQTGEEDGSRWGLVCPYWERRMEKSEQDCGYCHFLEKGDWESEGLSLLWDLCKECGINEDDDDDEDDESPKLQARLIVWAERVLPFVDDARHKKAVEKWLDNLKAEC